MKKKIIYPLCLILYLSRVKRERGFTLIELLVVVAIIGVLSALLMSNFIGVRQRARDAQRKSDIRQIQSALELYRSDNGSYPTTGNFPSCGSALQFTVGGQTSTYMQKVPCDPSTGSSYSYTSADGTTYSLIACLENSTDGQQDSQTGGSNNSLCANTTPATYSFTVKNP